MMLFAILFEDEPANAAAIRRQYMANHLDFLQASGCFIRAAGPLRQSDDALTGDAMAGGLWLVEARDAAEVDRLVRADPFWGAGLRRSVRVLVWDQVFSDGVCHLRQ